MLEELLNAKPFLMVRVVMRNGERVDIADRSKVAMGLTRMIVLLPRRTAELKYDEIEVAYQPRVTRTLIRSTGVPPVPIG